MSTTEHKSRAKDPAIVQEAQKPIKFIEKMIWWVVVVVAILGLVVWVREYREERELAKDPANCKNDDSGWVKIPAGFYKEVNSGECVEGTPPAPEQSATQQMVEALVLQKECLTPCSSFVGWNYKVRTDGDPIRVIGKDYTWDIPGKGAANPPKNFQPGETRIVSLGKNPQVDVWVYKKITIPAPPKQ